MKYLLALFALSLAPAIEAQPGCARDLCIDPGSFMCTTITGFSGCRLFAVSPQFDLELEVSADCYVDGDYFTHIGAGAAVFAGQGGIACQVPITGAVDGWFQYNSYWTFDFVQADANGYSPPPYDGDVDIFSAQDCLGFKHTSGPGGSLPCGTVAAD